MAESTPIAVRWSPTQRQVDLAVATPTSQTIVLSLGARSWETYKRLCYQWVGARLEREPSPRLTVMLRQAQINLTPPLYQSVLLVTFVLSLGVSLGFFGFLLGFGLRLDHWYLTTIILAGLFSLMVAGAFPFVVRTRIANRRINLDKELPFSLSELSVLASIGVSPIELVRRMSHREHDPAMTSEFRRVVFKTSVQGKDLITALVEAAKESPSELVRATFWDLANMIHQGGDLDDYLRGQSADVLEKKREGQKQFVERLGTYADIYITLVLIGIMFVGVGIFLLDSFGMTAGGLDGRTVLSILAYGFLPMVLFAIGFLLTNAHGRAE